MKRILCVCAVPVVEASEQSHESERTMIELGFAVSDPYLSHAIPIFPATTITTTTTTLRTDQNDATSVVEPTVSLDAMLASIGYRDIGALAVASPLHPDSHDSNGGMGNVHDTILSPAELLTRFPMLWRDFAGQDHEGSDDESEQDKSSSTNDSKICVVDKRISFGEAVKRKQENPAMWDEIDLQPEEGEDDVVMNNHDNTIVAMPSVIAPGVHAAIGLNLLLWDETGGWSNTFG